MFLRIFLGKYTAYLIYFGYLCKDNHVILTMSIYEDGKLPKMKIMNKMKTNLFVGLCLVLSICGISACSDSNAVPQPSVVTDISGVTEQDVSDIVAEDSGAVSWQDHFSAILKDAQQGNAEEDSLLAANAQRKLAVADSILTVYIDSLGSNGGQHGQDGKEDYSFWKGYKYVNIRYRSIDINGNPITLSELLIIPNNTVFPNPHPDNIIVACHDLITANKQRPSNFEDSEVKYFADWASTKLSCCVIPALAWYGSEKVKDNENLVIVPDYQGYGATHGDTHPFLERTLTARQVVDGVIAGKKWFEANGTSLEKDFKTAVVGYGEGASVAMGVHRYIEKNNLSKELNFVGSSCGGGFYDPNATFSYYLQDGKVYDVVTLCMMIKSLCATDSDMKSNNCTPSDYFTDAFLKSGILDWLDSKTYTNDEILEKLLAYSWNNSNGFSMMRYSVDDDKYLPYTSSNANKSNGGKRKWLEKLINHPAYCEIGDVLKQNVVEYLKTGSGKDDKGASILLALEKALSKYGVDKDWQPQHPMILVHSPNDEVAPIVNYENASKAFPGSNFKGIVYRGRVTNLYHYKSRSELFFDCTGTGLMFRLIAGKDMSNYKHDDITEMTATQTRRLVGAGLPL